jgi:hypothetical protein
MTGMIALDFLLARRQDSGTVWMEAMSGVDSFL